MLEKRKRVSQFVLFFCFEMKSCRLGGRSRQVLCHSERGDISAVWCRVTAARRSRGLSRLCVCPSCIPRATCSWSMDGIWAGEQFLALIWVENRKRAGRCLLSTPNLGQAAPLFTLLLSFDIYVSLRQSSITRFCLKRSVLNTRVHTYTFIHRHTTGLNGEPFLKENVCLIYNDLPDRADQESLFTCVF